MSDRRDWIIEGMGRCIVAIEQQVLPGEIGGMLITSHDPELDYFKLHILINSGLCNKTKFNDRANLKITAIHEFTHVVAALSAISRVRSKLLIERLKEIFKGKVHAINYGEIQKIANELRDSFFDMLEDIIDDRNSPTSPEHDGPKNTDREYYFPDNHFRLGFEDFPVSYPVIFEEFLLSKEMFEEYFPKDLINSLCEAFDKDNLQVVNDLISPPTMKMIKDKALYPHFAFARIIAIFMPIYTKYADSVKNR
jgi:hypothetical protein